MPQGMPYPTVDVGPAPWESPMVPPYPSFMGPTADVNPQTQRIAPPMPVTSGMPGLPPMYHGQLSGPNVDTPTINPYVTQTTPPAPMYGPAASMSREVAEVNPSVAEMSPMSMPGGSLTPYTAPPENKEGDAIMAEPSMPLGMFGIPGGPTEGVDRASPMSMRPRAMAMGGGGGGGVASPMPSMGGGGAMIPTPNPTINIPSMDMPASEMPMMQTGPMAQPPLRSMAMDAQLQPTTPQMPMTDLPPMNMAPSMGGAGPMMPGMRQPQNMMMPGGMHGFMGLGR